ncbi:MAG: exodeoxyribonuclease VII large subunit, partial [Erysipelotrichaceae bacterium]|nr:exodeoxyribonuclease VII large subunit [Erysipelotrichaceae bacterium]
ADPSRKKPLPAYPMRIGVVCGKDTAALADVKTTLQRRWPVSVLTIYPSLVQGKNACIELEKRLKEADEDQQDVILLVRGGGSLEDLWSFNEWNVIQTIVTMKTPVVSGVGHEVDITLVDYVSDKRAATPTAAAELVSPNGDEVIQRIQELKNRMLKDIRYRLDDETMRLVTNQKMMQNFTEKLQWKMQHVISQKEFLLARAQHLLTLYTNRVDVLKKRIELADQSERTNFYRKDIERYRKVLAARVYDLWKTKKTAFASEVQLLDAYSPLKVLSRGYAIATQDGKTLKRISDVDRTRNITLRLQDGTVDCRTVDKGD